MAAGEIGERFDDRDLIALARMEQGHALVRQGCVAEGLRLVDETMVAVTTEDLSPVIAGIEGELRMWAGDAEIRIGAGQSLLAPKGVPHTYRVESPGGARWLVVTTRGDFERFVRELSRPAERPGLPAPQGPPTPEQEDALAEAARQHGIELVGPPLAA